MSARKALCWGFLVLSLATLGYAQIFGTVRVVVRDPQNFAVVNAQVTVRAKNSEWMQMAKTDGEGVALIPAVPIGDYHVLVSAQGFAAVTDRDIQVTSNKITPLQVQLAVGNVEQSVNVTEELPPVNPESSTTENLTSRSDIATTPDADRTGSLAMITNNVPGTFVMHDHLHSRGGHGITWQIDGVPVPNSNLATVGSQFDPKDVDYLETKRGGLGANYGDRSYGVFNVVPRSGFEGQRFGEFLATYGNYHQTNEYLNFGSHTNRLAYYGSLAGSRTDLGLERVDVPVLHDQSASFSGFTSLVYNPTPMNQLRFVGSSRRDHYHVPNTEADQAAGIRDIEIATDTFTNFTWVHTGGSGTLLTVSPYYHFNRGQYIGGKGDPIVTDDNRGSHYVGGYVNFEVTRGKHTFRVGTDLFREYDTQFFAITDNTLAKPIRAEHRQKLNADIESVFAEDSFRVTRWLTLNDGVRFERFSGILNEHSTSPRLGAAINVPYLGVFRGSYSRYYQHPQVSTISGPIIEFAAHQGFTFLPIPGERDEIWEVGWAIPIHGWTLDFDRFHNRTRNAVDHDVLGNSSLLLPLTIERGRVRAYESTLRSPQLFNRLRLHYSLSYMTAQGAGKITGGLTNFQPPKEGFFLLDHDQRVTLAAGSELSLPGRLWLSDTVIYGSGFLRGDGPHHMPHHTTLDLALGKNIGENLSLKLTALNVTNNLFLTGIDNSFAGTHYYAPREISVQLRYRFHY